MAVQDTGYVNFIGNLAVITTVMQFLSGVLVCKQYVRDKTTAETSALPFLFGVLSTGFWFLYGDTKHDGKIMLVNAIGLILMVFYVVVFYIYSSKKRFLIIQILSCVVFCLFLYGYLIDKIDSVQTQLDVLGFLACNLTLLTLAAPLVKLKHVITVKSTECLPFPMILMSFIVSALWYVYGYLNEDIFMIVQNIIGGVLALFQLCLFYIYPSRANQSALNKMVQA